MTEPIQPGGVRVEDDHWFCFGQWITPYLRASAFPLLNSRGHVIIDCQGLSALDTNGALLFAQTLGQLKQRGQSYSLQNLQPAFQAILDLVTETQSLEQTEHKGEKLSGVANVGRKAVQTYEQILFFLAFLGELSIEALSWIRKPQTIRNKSLTHVIFSTGYQAMGIVALLSFLIGIVLCYQMGLQLAQYGASIYVVDLLGISILREFGPFLTAIIVAGRTGSAYAAQIGTMKLNQELDAIKTMGLSPMELLILPKITGLMIALPLLTVLSMLTGVGGGMVMAKVLFDIPYLDFIHRFGSVIQFKTLVLGMIKTPVFAFFISTIGCFQGLQVSHSAQSVGEKTTASVVQGIFLIIIIDAFFSILYSKLGL